MRTWLVSSAVFFGIAGHLYAGPVPQPNASPEVAPSPSPAPQAATPPAPVTAAPAAPSTPPQESAATAPAAPVTQSTVSTDQFWSRTMNEQWISLGFSPLYKPKSSSQLGSSLKLDFDLTLRFGITSVGFRYARGTVGHLFLPDDTIALNAIHQIWCLYMQPEIPLYAPYQSLGPIMPFIPIFLGMNVNVVSARLVHYYNLGFDVGTGVGARWYLSDNITLDGTALYHFGIPLWKVRETSFDPVLVGPGGEEVTGSTGGFEFRVAVSFLVI